MSIRKCPKMTSMVSINDNNSGGSINADNFYDHHSFLLFCEPEKVSFGNNLKKLTTDRNPFSCGHKVHESLFNGLEKLEINEYGGSMSLFSPSITGNLVNLIELSIRFCDELVEVIKDDEEEDRQRTTLLFPKLQKLQLWLLPKLVSFCEWKCDVELPSLKKVNIERCPNMKYLTLGFLAAPNLEAFGSDFNNYRQVPYDNQKVLSIEGNETPFYPYIIPVSLFNGLQQLTIWEYKGSMSLFTSSTAENLVSLRELSIDLCDEIELELNRLPKLVSFCEWKCDVKLPSLKKVDIKSCPNMKYFTLGLLTTPKLESIKIDYKDFGGVKDLNDTLHQHYLAQEKKKQEEEKKGGAEEQERKGDQRQS
ncbi:hypothetical protein C2S53_018223 [Perilla frutescens var. hirtella]|uniref:Disease resistance protein At4g27190-like leucine-rich repeats domain-containing protein n=1 Tax=Perilla frutescens var. hirtella TaxID=608512 RepID=A0AAD4IM20_PERFH|nr:hypothetical protein C2S53_018223 [Perilla frutescens var. hirtella]